MRINHAFLHMLSREAGRLGMDAPRGLALAETASVRERYAPMSRLLIDDDRLFLIRQGLPEAAKNLRREHRSCYFGYVRRLAQEVREARRLGALAMASEGHWRLGTLLARTLVSESSLLYLRWLGWQHALGITVAARDVAECLELLLAGPRFQPATT